MKLLLALAAAAVLASPALAGSRTYSSSDAKKSITPEECPPDSRLLFRATSSYVFESDFERGDNASGDALQSEFDFGYRIPVELGWPNAECGQWYLRLGARYTRFDFGHEGGLPLPSTLQSAAAVVALEYLQRGEIGVLFETRPGVYFEHDINTGAFDSPTILALAIPITDNFYGIVGASGSLLRSYPVIPLVGFFWRVSPEWTVKAYLPEPRIIYSPTENLSFWVGGELTGGSFRVDDDQGRQANLRNAVVTYSEYRASAGVTWSAKNYSVEVGGGYAFQRKFDYHRAEEGFATDEGAPFVKVELRAAF
jgi:hypothetical protein